MTNRSPESLMNELWTPYKDAYLQADNHLQAGELYKFYKSASKVNEYGIKIAKRYQALGLPNESEEVIDQLKKVIVDFLNQIKRPQTGII